MTKCAFIFASTPRPLLAESILRAERRLRLIDEPAEIGMDMSRASRPATRGVFMEDFNDLSVSGVEHTA